jgi:hypothetical protein
MPGSEEKAGRGIFDGFEFQAERRRRRTTKAANPAIPKRLVEVKRKGLKRK